MLLDGGRRAVPACVFQRIPRGYWVWRYENFIECCCCVSLDVHDWSGIWWARMNCHRIWENVWLMRMLLLVAFPCPWLENVVSEKRLSNNYANWKLSMIVQGSLVGTNTGLKWCHLIWEGVWLLVCYYLHNDFFVETCVLLWLLLLEPFPIRTECKYNEAGKVDVKWIMPVTVTKYERKIVIKSIKKIIWIFHWIILPMFVAG